MLRPYIDPSPQSSIMTIDRYRVLIVDDNEADIELLRIAFEMAGLEVEVECAPDGMEAIRILGQAAHDEALPALMLLDLNMPRANGFEVLAFMHQRQLDEQVAVVVLSTSGQAEDQSRCLALGARAMYRKPESVQELRHLVAGFDIYLNPTEPSHEH